MSENDKKQETAAEKPGSVARPRKSISMHADVEVWDDCCSCEAEPYWVESLREDDSD